MAKTGYFSGTFTKINNLVLRNEKIRNLKSMYYYIDGIGLKFVKKPKQEQNSKIKVIIVYNLSLGDGAMFNCALKNIRKIYPEDKYELTIICQKGLNKIYEATNLFDYVLAYNFTKSAVDLKERMNLFKELRKKQYDILLDPIGIEDCSTNILVSRAICSKEKIGIINYGRKVACSEKIYKKVYNKILELNDPKMHLIDHYFEFFNLLGNLNIKPKFVNLPSEPLKEKIDEDYFIVYPSASTEYKRWPVERIAEITKRIYERTKIPLVVCGTNVDRQTNDELINLIKDDVKYIDMTGKTSILEYIDLIKKSKFVITNDTGIYHVAVVSEVPVCITAGAYTYDRYLTYKFNGADKYKKPYVACVKMECANCDNRCIKANELEKTWPCLDAVTVDMAWEKVSNMLENLNF